MPEFTFTDTQARTYEWGVAEPGSTHDLPADPGDGRWQPSGDAPGVVPAPLLAGDSHGDAGASSVPSESPESAPDSPQEPAEPEAVAEDPANG